MEQSKELQSPLVMTFVDFQKAFDSIDRYSIWEILCICRMPSKIINIIKSLYVNVQCSIKIENATGHYSGTSLPILKTVQMSVEDGQNKIKDGFSFFTR